MLYQSVLNTHYGSQIVCVRDTYTRWIWWVRRVRLPISRKPRKHVGPLIGHHVPSHKWSGFITTTASKHSLNQQKSPNSSSKPHQNRAFSRRFATRPHYSNRTPHTALLPRLSWPTATGTPLILVLPFWNCSAFRIRL